MMLRYVIVLIRSKLMLEPCYGVKVPNSILALVIVSLWLIKEQQLFSPKNIGVNCIFFGKVQLNKRSS